MSPTEKFVDWDFVNPEFKVRKGQSKPKQSKGRRPEIWGLAVYQSVCLVFVSVCLSLSVCMVFVSMYIQPPLPTPPQKHTSDVGNGLGGGADVDMPRHRLRPPPVAGGMARG